MSEASTPAEEHAERSYRINGFRTGNTQNLRDARGDLHLVRVEIRVTLPHKFDYRDEGHRLAVLDEIQRQIVECLPTTFHEVESRLPAVE